MGRRAPSAALNNELHRAKCASEPFGELVDAARGILTVVLKHYAHLTHSGGEVFSEDLCAVSIVLRVFAGGTVGQAASVGRRTSGPGVLAAPGLCRDASRPAQLLPSQTHPCAAWLHACGLGFLV